MESLERLFQQIIRNLTAVDPDRLRSPLQLGELRETIVPYRANRRALQVESSEDYELALIRLCAGEGGYGRMQPREIQAEFAAEALSSNPDLTIALRHPEAELSLSQEHLTRVLHPEPHQAYAPPAQRYAPAADTKGTNPADIASRKGSRASKGARSDTANCRGCGGKLPTGLPVKFCPHCGVGQTPAKCPACRAELEVSWRHCVSCGHAVSGG
jgi:hypothetical protein